MIPYSKPNVTQEDIDSVLKVLKGDWLTTGPVVTSFEEEFAKFVGCKHAIAVCNGTAALHLSCQALNIKKGHLGITSAITFLASANCLEYVGAETDFIDVDKNTLTFSPDKLIEYINNNKKPDIIIPVHFAGIPCDMEQLSKICKEYDIKMIEDSCHALGSKYMFDGNYFYCGSSSHSDISIFSFHAVKTVTAGEGGMITTNNDEYAKFIRRQLNHSIVRELEDFVPWKICNYCGEILDDDNKCKDVVFCNKKNKEKAPWLYQQQNLGFNYRITDIQSALGLSQIKRIDKTLARRDEIFKKYKLAFKNSENINLLEEIDNSKPAYHLAIIRIKNNNNVNRSELVEILRKEDVFAQIHYIPVYLQPYFSNKYGFCVGKAPNAEKVYSNMLSIPLYPSIEDSQINVIIDIIKKHVNE